MNGANALIMDDPENGGQCRVHIQPGNTHLLLAQEHGGYKITTTLDRTAAEYLRAYLHAWLESKT